tara:strand:- start:372 stop:584 length:213 start_codon:yes stop_codon:yes gene_type:complete
LALGLTGSVFLTFGFSGAAGFSSGLLFLALSSAGFLAGATVADFGASYFLGSSFVLSSAFFSDGFFSTAG